LPPPPTAAVVGWKYETPATRSFSPTTRQACSHRPRRNQRHSARHCPDRQQLLAEASDLIRQLTGISEIDYETTKATKRNGQPHHAVTVDDLPTIDQQAHDAAGRGADYISMRRLSERIGATALESYADLGNLIATERPARYAPSISRTTVEPGSH
jgi:hypothetical protein